MLFRKQVIEAQRKRLYGEVLIISPIKSWIITGFLVGMIAILLVFLATASFARIEKVRGAVVPSDGLVLVRAPSAGVLTDFDVTEGQHVDVGDVVGRITASAGADDAGTRIGAELASIASSIEQLDARTEQLQIVTQLEIAAKDRVSGELGMQIGQTEAALEFQLALLDETEGASDRTAQLWSRNLVNAEAVSQQTIQLIRARQEVQTLQARIETLQTQRDNISHEQEQIRAHAYLDELQLATERSARLNDRRIISGTQAFDLAAPASGVATAVLVSDGFNLSGAQQIFSILPEGSALEVELYVASRAIGFVEAGQTVRLLFDAFPYQRFGAQTGEVVEVTSSAIMPGNGDFFIETNEPVYRVTVALREDTIPARDRDLAVQAGMLLNANIVLEERSILTWLLEPLFSVARRS